MTRKYSDTVEFNQEVFTWRKLAFTDLFFLVISNATIVYRQEVASLFQVQEKLRACKNLK